MSSRLIDIIAPPGTSRRQLPGIIKEAVQIWRKDGAKAALDNLYHIFLDHGYGLLLSFGITLPRVGTPPPAYGYQEWIADHEPSQRELAQQTKLAHSFALRPNFSIITPVYNPPAQVFVETVESVLAQTYPDWCLYLADGGSDDPEVLAALEHFVQRDSRIQVLTLPENLGISGNSNAALEKTDGDFVALLDHDDLLAKNMLFEVAKCINKEAEAAGTTQIDDVPVDIIYFDEDKISADGKSRRDPWMKPAKAHETLLSHNVFMHCVIRRSILNEVAGFDPKMDGAQDWDLMLRCSLQTDHFVHIPKILYHWRQIEGSAALDANAKPWALDAQINALKRHLTALGARDADVTMPKLGHLRIMWPHHNTKVSIIILTKNKSRLIQACIRSILEKSSYPNYEIIIVDTGSTEQDTLDFYATLADESHVQLVHYHGRFNFSKANNFGATFASGDALLFLNNDTEVLEPTWLEEMVGWVCRPEIGIVGTKLIRPDDTIQHTGVIMGLMGHAYHVFDGAKEDHFGPFGSSELLRNYQAVTGACMLIKRSCFEELGGFDELYEIIFNDVDLCLRTIQKGYRIVCTPTARMLHHEGSSRGIHNPIADVIRATCQMWPTIRQIDPYFNPNLSYLNPVPTFSQPHLPRIDQHVFWILQQYKMIPEDASNKTKYADLFHNDDGMLPQPSQWPRSADGQHIDRRRLAIILPSWTKSDVSFTASNPNLLTALASSGNDITLLTSGQHDEQDMLSSLGVGRTDIVIQNIPNLLTDVRVTVRTLIGSCGPFYDLIIVNGVDGWLAVHAAKAFDVPVLYVVNHDEEQLVEFKENRHLGESIAYATKSIFADEKDAMNYYAYQNNQNFEILGIDSFVENMVHLVIPAVNENA